MLARIISGWSRLCVIAPVPAGRVVRGYPDDVGPAHRQRQVVRVDHPARHIFHLSAGKVCASHVRAPQEGVVEVGVRNVSGCQLRSAHIRVRQVSANQVRARQVRVVKAGRPQIAPRPVNSWRRSRNDGPISHRWAGGHSRRNSVGAGQQANQHCACRRNRDQSPSMPRHFATPGLTRAPPWLPQ